SVLRRLALLVESDPLLDRLDARPPVAVLDAEIPAGHVPGSRTAGLVFRFAGARHPRADPSARHVRGLRDLRGSDRARVEAEGGGGPGSLRSSRLVRADARLTVVQEDDSMWPLVLLLLADSTGVFHVPVAAGEFLQVSVTGTGAPVVLISGLFGSAFGFRHVVPRLAAAGYQVIVVEPLGIGASRSEEHTSELQSRENLVCRLL